MRLFAFVLSLSLLGLAAPAAAQAGCTRCETQLVLDERQWDCLLRRLPSMQGAGETVFFSLSPQVCSGDTTRAVIIPGPSDAPGNRFFRLSRAQLACLARKAPGKARSSQVVFNFATECAAAAALPDYYVQARQQVPAAPAPPITAAPAPIALAPPPAETQEEAPVSPYEAYRRLQR